MSAAQIQPKVLIVDDEPDNIAVLTRVLRRSYQVRAASSGAEALELLKRESFDIVITDQRMPGMSGTDLLAASEAYAPNAIRIVVSAFSDFDAILDAINVAGASAFLTKPITSGMLEGAIARAVSAKAKSRPVVTSIEQLERRNRELEARVRELEASLGKSRR